MCRICMFDSVFEFCNYFYIFHIYYLFLFKVKTFLLIINQHKHNVYTITDAQKTTWKAGVRFWNMGDIGKIRFHASGVIGKYSLNVGHTKTSMLAYRGLLLTSKLLNQGFLLVKLKSSIRKFYGRHHDLVDRYGLSVSQMTRICSMCTSPSFPHP